MVIFLCANTLLTAPRGGSTAAPDKFCAFVSIDSGSGELTQSLEFSDLRSLAFGFCQFLAVLGIFSKLCGIRAQKDLAMLNYCAKGVPSGVAGSCREWHAACRLPNCQFWYKLFDYFAPTAAPAPPGHYFGPKATLIF